MSKVLKFVWQLVGIMFGLLLIVGFIAALFMSFFVE